MNNEKNLLNRIIIDQDIMAGQPVIKGTRLTVPHIFDLLIQGMSTSEILEDYKNLKYEDILACYAYAKANIEDTTFKPLGI